MRNWSQWNFNPEQFNFRPVKGKSRKEEMVRLKEVLSSTAIKFTELVLKDIKAVFGYLTAAQEADHERYWGSDLISVTVFREENEYFLTVVGSCEGEKGPTGFTLSFSKPQNWNKSIDLKPFYATGNAEDVITLAGVFLHEWPKCHKLKYSHSKNSWE